MGGRGEVPHVAGSVEAHEVGAKKSLQHALATRQRAEDLHGGEGDVEEEADARARRLRAEQRRHPHELVVVHPDEVVRLELGEHRIGEALVDALVGGPPPRLQWHAVDQRVKERPHHPVPERLVVVAHLDARQRHRHAAAALPFIALRRKVRWLVIQTRPSEPESRARVVHGMQAGGEAAGALLQRELSPPALGGQRESVRDEQESGQAPSGRRMNRGHPKPWSRTRAE
jgi:hypothetical protein